MTLLGGRSLGGDTSKARAVGYRPSLNIRAPLHRLPLKSIGLPHCVVLGAFLSLEMIAEFSTLCDN
jgi:hypothetical protein